MRNSQCPVQTSSFHTWPPQLFQHGIRPQPGIPIQRSSILPFLGTNLSFLLTWGRSNYPPAQIWGGDPEIKVLHFQPGLLTQLPRLPYLQRHQRLWRDWGAERFLDPPSPPAVSSLLNPLLHCFSSFQTSFALSPHPLSPSLWVSGFSKKRFMVTSVGFSRRAKLIVCVQFTIFTQKFPSASHL